MDNQQPSKFKSALNFGTILGLVLMLISLLIFVFELYDQSKWLNWVGTAILVAGIVIGTKKFRDNECGGFISYGSALGYGTMVALFAGIITSFFTYIYLGFIDDGFVQHSLMVAEDDMYNQGMPEEQIQMAMEYTKKFMSPGVLATFGVLANVFLGFIVSLIAAAFLKNEAENFEDTH